mmetsp:Transcript_8565/g.14732  ORF Transcript_8565/g.14732 Transcript_8565/m.14732 type:complete len:525 (-) Transcript_8565:57-1631(-)
MGKVCCEHTNASSPIEVKCSAEDVIRYLSDVEKVAQCYPDADKVEKLGDGTYKWTMTERNVATVRLRGVQVCKYSRDGNSVVWEAVDPTNGDKTNMQSNGKFLVEPTGDSSCKVLVEAKLETEVPIPQMLVGFARKLAEREMRLTWNAYLEAIKKAAETGELSKGVLNFEDPLGERLQQRHDPAARTKDYLGTVNAYYDAVTEIYRSGWGNHFHFGLFFDKDEPAEVAIKRLETVIVTAGNISKECKVLDIGCGVGGPTCNIALMSGAKVTGLNINEKQLDMARKRAEELGVSDSVNFECADAMKMPYPDNTFDVITFFESVCHMPDKDLFFQECFRVLKPGGRISASDWMQCENPTEQEVHHFIEPICSAHAVPHMGSVGSYRRSMEKAGFIVATAVDLRVEGDILRNWEMLDSLAIKSFHEKPKELFTENNDPLMDMLITGGVALSEGAKAGVFILGRFLALKPTSPMRWDPPANYGIFPVAKAYGTQPPLVGPSTVEADRNLKRPGALPAPEESAKRAKKE